MIARMFSLAGKTALVTGAGSGIGAAIAEMFARAGARVFATDRDEAAARETAARITAASGKPPKIQRIRRAGNAA